MALNLPALNLHRPPIADLAGGGTGPIVAVRENFVPCDVLFAVTARHGKSTLSARRRMRAAACRGSGPRLHEAWPFFCIYPHDRTSPCKWTHEKALSK